jgi:hypothetical protein
MDLFDISSDIKEEQLVRKSRFFKILAFFYVKRSDVENDNDERV